MFERKEQYRINLSPIGFEAKKYFERRYELEKDKMKEWMRQYVSKYNQNTIYTNDGTGFWQSTGEGN